MRERGLMDGGGGGAREGVMGTSLKLMRLVA